MTVIEFTMPGSAPVLAYAVTDALGNSVPYHRVLGMLVDVQHELAAHTTNYRRRQQDES